MTTKTKPRKASNGAPARKLLFFPLPAPYVKQLERRASVDGRSVSAYIALMVDDCVQSKISLAKLPPAIQQAELVEICTRMPPDSLAKLDKAVAAEKRSRRTFMKLMVMKRLDDIASKEKR